jgi:hypothetical protein
VVSTRADKAGRAIAERLFPDVMPCEVCGQTGFGRGVIDRHHRDGDRMNNAESNIAFLCRRDHVAAHRLLDGQIGGGVRPRVNEMLRSKAIARSAEAARLRDAGQTTRQIAASLGVDPWTVLRWFQKYEA